MKTTSLKDISKAACLVLLGSLLVAHNVSASTSDEFAFKKKRFSLGVGGILVRLDTNFRFTSKPSGRHIFIDAEGSLGLPETDIVPALYGYYRFSRRHAIGFSYFRINREASLFDESANLGDLTLSGRATLTDKTSFYLLGYNYTFRDDGRSFIYGSFGLYGLDLKYTLNAQGDLSFRGTPLATDTFEEEASVFAPLPLFGIDAWFALTPKWSFGSRVSLVGGSYQDISATVIDSAIRGRYVFNKHVAGIVGVSYFNSDITIDDSDLKTEVAYGFDGFFLGLDIGF